MKSRLFFLLALAGMGAFAACSSGNNTGLGGICDETSVTYPLIQMLYPESGATGVPDNFATLTYGSSPNENLGAAAFVPITLGVGAGAPGTVTSTETTPPTVLPTPNATPNTTASTFAVSVPSLSPATTYTVYASVFYQTCSGVGTESKAIGTFTTQ